MRSQQYNRSRFLYGAIPQTQVTAIVRGQCIPEEAENLDQIIVGWRKAANLFREIESKEAGIADNNATTELSSEHSPKLNHIRNDVLFKNSFSAYSSDFRIVDVEKLIATQRSIDLSYIVQLTPRISKNVTMDELIDFCLSPSQNVPMPQSFQLASNLVTYSSPSKDFRFVGGFPKQLTTDDLKYALSGGVPVGAIILFVGYGAGSVNVLEANNRLILNNGFHRVYALRKSGVTKIPVVLQHFRNPDLEMPADILGLSRDYLLKHQRPVLVKDFFVDELTTVLRLKKTVRSVRVQWGFEQADMAI